MAAEEAGRRMAANEAEGAGAAAPAPAPVPKKAVVEEKDDDEDLVCLATNINACHIAADKGRRLHMTQKEVHEAEVAAAIVAVGKWLDERGIFAWAPNVERALQKELPEAGLGDYLYIAKALLS